ncbi:hypothetical protein, partial [Methanosaeta sp. UBA458]|uniref:hypothetical protein n=1 Tax=Methanosaeta sp. UBA458 TaxID=1915561 RepID=UPI00257C03A7
TCKNKYVAVENDIYKSFYWVFRSMCKIQRHPIKFPHKWPLILAGDILRETCDPEDGMRMGCIKTMTRAGVKKDGRAG